MSSAQARQTHSKFPWLPEEMEKAVPPLEGQKPLCRVLWAWRAGLAMSLPPLGISPPQHPFCGLVAELQLRQGIERLKRKNQPRERTGSWQSVKETFGGDFSLNWFNPFSRPCQPEIPSDKDMVRQVTSLSDTETMEDPSEETKDEDSVEVTDE